VLVATALRRLQVGLERIDDGTIHVARDSFEPTE
jgi:hypothetical protein